MDWSNGCREGGSTPRSANDKAMSSEDREGTTTEEEEEEEGRG
jgi:hypothetical protein